jgi:hypothetical protein
VRLSDDDSMVCRYAPTKRGLRKLNAALSL